MISISVGLAKAHPNNSSFIATVTFPGQVHDSTGGPGRPRFVINTAVLEPMIELGFSVVSIANVLEVSRSTVCRRLMETGLSASQKYCCISNCDLDDVVQSISHAFPNCGYKMTMGYLAKSYHLS